MIKDLGKIKGVELGSRLLADEETENEDLWNMATDDLY